MQSVSRDGKFGLLDSTGAELVPCAYDGLVWDGGTAWVRLGFTAGTNILFPA